MTLRLRTLPELPVPILPSSIREFFPPATDVLGKFGPREYEFFHGLSEVTFRPDRVEFCPTAAWLLSDCAFLAYSTRGTAVEVEAEIRPALARLFRSSFELKVFIGSALCWNELLPDDRIQCYVAHDGVWGVVAFRGTLPDSVPNWLTDANFALEPDPGAGAGRVHRGFKAALECLWRRGREDGLESYLHDTCARFPNLRLWFTGHSLGAAMAVLAAHRFGRADALYSFGSPKVGDATFVAEMSRLQTPHFRVVNHRDIVTELPFFPPFGHCGSLTFLQEPRGVVGLIRDAFASIGFGHPLWKLRRHFDDASKLGREFQEHVGILRASLDHSPVLYSKNLWNQLVRSAT